MQSIKQLQKLLNHNGNKLKVDGIYGPITGSAIEILNVPTWVKIAMKEVGEREIRGKKHNERVLEYHAVSGGYREDEVPWCGSFVNWVMLKSGVPYTVSVPARAKSWLKYGISSVVPIVGSVAVKSRRGGGHVCFIVGKDKNGDLYCLGGNQNDQVNIKLYPKGAFLDFRVPATYADNNLPIYALNVNNKNKEV